MLTQTQTLQQAATMSSPTLIATTLAIDLGTKSGYAVGFRGTISKSLMSSAVAGTWELLTEQEAKEQRKRGGDKLGDIRYYRIRDRIIATCAAHGVTRIVFEDVKFSNSAFQTQLWSSLRTALWEVADRLGLELRAIPVSTLKSFACGNSHADKTEMEAALRARESESESTFELGDDNEIDARWLLCYTLAVDQGTSNWEFGYQLRQGRKIAARARKAQRRVKTAERREAARADGLDRLVSILKELGETMSATAARRAVMELCRNGSHTIDLPGRVIEGSLLKNGGLRWKLRKPDGASKRSLTPGKCEASTCSLSRPSISELAHLSPFNSKTKSPSYENTTPAS